MSRPEVDPARIGIIGNSGGGTQASLAVLFEPRIAAAAPGTFIMNRESYLFAGQAQDRGNAADGGTVQTVLADVRPRRRFAAVRRRS
ncbi:hypothetical protein FE783_20805 [Paenibacillus mesophilus]|uniref:hypothetical protein n=1 Tax=Paenibacillus mesophilus TaxID=2582849 RepID=UPI00110DFC2E|nr:hypothetical protein [Paenibacillus mesophilus]TMV47869.1 hypothetical protein FE783_20805 [Paenibacillus mesophilus]